MKKIIGITAVIMMVMGGAMQAQEQRSSSSIYLQALPKADNTLVFSASAEGKRFEPEWGLDLAWMDEHNLLRGFNHMGAANISFGRSSYRVCAPLKDDVSLVKEQWQGLYQRNQLFDKVSTTLPVILNCDNGYSPSTTSGTNIDAYYTKNGRAIIDHWAAMLDAHVAWMKRNASKHPVIGVSIMNEPDFKGNTNDLIQGTAADICDIAKKLRTDYSENFDGIVLVGPNTLNDDKVMSWYNTCKEYVEWGNTHQLAGSFDNYAGFYDQLQKDGKVGFNDEMHNVAEAFIGLEHGMTKGIWWGFDSRARGEFCNISRNGSRLAYSENRTKWTAACVYRNDKTKQIKAFVGGSERQSNTTKYRFVSLDDDVYYDGQGPFREFEMEHLSAENPEAYGTELHTNGERVIDITNGEDVAPSVINGDYIIMNTYNKQVVSQVGSDIRLMKYTKGTSQQWSVTPVSARVGGDYSFFDIISKNDGYRLNVLNHSVESGANVMSYDAKGDINEQWYLEYAGKGNYYIRNRESALYLAAEERNLTKTNVNVCQNKKLTGTEADRLLWRIIPLDAECETSAPKAPQGLTATANNASVILTWDANSENDLEGYMIVRGDENGANWTTIARKITTNYFIDNTCRQGRTYSYKVRAIDHSDNLSSQFSSTVQATPTGDRALVARWHFDDNAYDATPNMMDAVIAGNASYVTNHKSGEKALSLNGSSNYVKLPYEAPNSKEFTFAAWVYWGSIGTDTWQRIFDFGYDTDHYMFLTPNAGSKMRFAIKNGGDEQLLECNRLNGYAWKFVTVTMSNEKVSIFVDGVELASTTSITIRPEDIHPIVNYLGRSQFDSDPYFKGYIDDVRIYNYALSPDEIVAAMNDQTNAIHQLNIPNVELHPAIYGVDGRRYETLKRGMNIIDGRKVIK